MDDAARFQRVSELFESLRDLPPDQIRRALELVEPKEVRTEIEEMIAADRSDAPAVRTIVDVAGVIDEALEPPAVPAQIGGHEVLGVVGYGSAGVVLRARHASTGETVAVKVLASGAWNPSALARFRREVRLLERLHHPCIGRIIEAGTDTTGVAMQPYFVMEYIEGETLSAWLRSAPRSSHAVLRVFIDLIDAVGYAHAAGIVHRDLKPGNLLVTAEGRAKVLDFGVAAFAGDETAADHLRTLTRKLGIGRRTASAGTRSGALIGTLPYMSPEQFASPAQVDWRSDLYSIGVMLFEALAGRLPYRAGVATLHEAATTIRTEHPLTLGSIDRSMRGEIEAVVARLLEKDPERRYQSAPELREDLIRLHDGRPTVVRPIGRIERVRRFAARYPRLVAVAAAISLCLIGALGYAVHRWQLAIEQRAQLAASVERREREDYDRALREASAAVRAGAFEAARSALALAPASLRGFEWNHLAREASGDARTLITYGLAKTLRGAAGRVVYRGAEERFLAIDSLLAAPRTLGRAALGHLSVAISPDGTRVATVDGSDAIVVVRSAAPASDGAILAAIDLAEQGVRAPAVQVDWSRDGRSIAVLAADGTVAGVDPDSGAPTRVAVRVGSTGASAEPPTGMLRFLGDGGRLVACSRGASELSVLSPDGAVVVRDLAPKRIESIATGRGEAELAVVGCDDGTILVIGPDPADAPRAIDAHRGPVYAIALDRADAVIASSGGDSIIRLWEVDTGLPAGTVGEARGGARALEIVELDEGASGSGGAAGPVEYLIAAIPDGSLRFLPLAESALEPEILAHRGREAIATFLPNETLATLAADAPDEVLVWEPHQRVPIASVPLEGALRGKRVVEAFALDAADAGASRLAIVAVDSAGAVSIVLASADAPVVTIEAGRLPGVLACRIDPRSVVLASPSSGVAMLVRSAAGGVATEPLPPRAAGCTACCPAGDGGVIFAAGAALLVGERPESSSPSEIFRATAPIGRVAASRSGELIVAALEDGALVAIESDRGGAHRVRWRVVAPGDGPPGALAVAPDGRRIAIASSEGETMLLDARDGRVLHAFEPALSMTRAVSFSQRGTMLAFVRTDGTVRIIDASLPESTRSALGGEP